VPSTPAGGEHGRRRKAGLSPVAWIRARTGTLQKGSSLATAVTSGRRTGRVTCLPKEWSMSARAPEPGAERSKTTVVTFRDKHRRGEPLSLVTAYDFPTARAVDAAGVDGILVGDSLAMVVLGHPNTLSVTMDEMLHHAKAVSRGARGALLIGDLPFLSYQADEAEAVRNAGRFLAESGMDAVKLEGGRPFVSTIRAIVRAGIPVQGHIGLTPQRANALGGFKVQGRRADEAQALLDDARALEDAGCFSIVLEAVPDRLATFITERVTIPTVGIGAGPGTSGQILVLHDLLGLTSGHTPKFVKRYADLAGDITRAVSAYRADVESHAFPSAEQSYAMADEEWETFRAHAGERRPRPVQARAR
jgi:3-methyl-2-oxobutanoate hydroxymethyltransferase